MSSKVEAKKPEQKNKASKKAEHVKRKLVQAGAIQNPASQPMATHTGKKRLMVSYEKLTDEVIEAIRAKYPYGYNHDLKEVKGIDNKKFFVLPIELPDVVYLVKVDLRKPIKFKDPDEEEDMFTPEEEFAGEEDNFPAEDLEQIEGDEDEGAEDEAKKRKKDEDEEE